MRTILKSIIGLVLTCVLLVVIALTAIVVFIDPNDYKQDIVTLVKQHTGREIVLREPIKLSVFPWLGIETGEVILGNASGFGETPFARIDRLGLKLKLVPLLSQSIEVDTLLLHGLQVNLVRNAQGQTNWADLIQPNPTSDTSTTAPSSPPALSVQQIDIQDANLSWNDHISGQHYQIQQFNLASAGLTAGVNVPVQARFQLLSSEPATDIQFKMQTELAIGANHQRFTLNNLQMTAVAEDPILPADGIQIGLGAEIDIDLAEQRLQVKALQLEGPELGIQGQVNFTQWATKPQIRGQLKLANTNLKRLLAILGTSIETQNPQALTNFSANLTLEYDNQQLRLEPLAFILDGSTLQGNIALDVTKTIPALQAELQIDQFNLDDYMPSTATETVTPSSSQSTKDTKTTHSVLHAFNLAAELRINQLQANKARLTDVQLKMQNQQGLLTLKPIQANLYSGQFNGDISLDARTEPMVLAANKQLTGIQIGPLLRDVVGQDQLEGRGDLQLRITTNGINEQAIRNSLAGSAAFQFTDGAYKGVNLAELIQGAARLLRLNLEQPSSSGEKRTDFAMIKGSLQINQGVIRNRDLQLQSPLLRITGQGSVDLAADQVDYMLTTKLVKTLAGQGGKTSNQLKGIPIPVRISGPLANLSYTPDLSGMLQASVQQRIQQEQDKVLNNVQDKVKQKAAELLGSPKGLEDALQGLKGLFGQ